MKIKIRPGKFTTGKEKFFYHFYHRKIIDALPSIFQFGNPTAWRKMETDLAI